MSHSNRHSRLLLCSYEQPLHYYKHTCIAFHVNWWDTFKQTRSTSTLVHPHKYDNQARTHTQYTKAKEPDSSHLHSQALQNKLRLSLFPVVGNKTAVLGFASRKLPAAGWPIEQKNKVSIVSANLRYEKSRDSSVQCMQLCSRVAYGGGCAEELLLWSEPQVAYSVSVFKQESRCSAKGT